jgi:hypothetical protein
MTRDIEALEKLAAAASPSVPEGNHLSEAELAALRIDDESSSLEEAYRHLASCAACRARLSEPSRDVRALVESVPPEAPQDAKLSDAGPRARNWSSAARLGAGLALAASVAIVFGITRGAGREPLLIQRSFVGVMGESPAPSSTVAVRDRNLELDLEGKSIEAARLLIVDSNGRVLAPWLILRPASSGLRVVLARRTLAPHRGTLHAIIVYGGASSVANAVAPIRGRNVDSGARSLHELRAMIQSRARAAGARVMSEQLLAG